MNADNEKPRPKGCQMCQCQQTKIQEQKKLTQLEMTKMQKAHYTKKGVLACNFCFLPSLIREAKKYS
jgi:hypothetical protein